jgi:hypothetical protein
MPLTYDYRNRRVVKTRGHRKPNRECKAVQSTLDQET